MSNLFSCLIITFQAIRHVGDQMSPTFTDAWDPNCKMSKRSYVPNADWQHWALGTQMPFKNLSYEVGKWLLKMGVTQIMELFEMIWGLEV